jgi:hypothetical protein
MAPDLRAVIAAVVCAVPPLFMNGLIWIDLIGIPTGLDPRKVDDADAAKARSLRDKGITATDIGKMLGVSRATVYRYLSECASLPV